MTHPSNGQIHELSSNPNGIELRPIPRLSKAQISIPFPLYTPSSELRLSSFAWVVPTSPSICGFHESCVPANPEPKFNHVN
ncbi:hypothetical protein LXL04_011819 [Taraxacum kok-saghyz]